VRARSALARPAFRDTGWLPRPRSPGPCPWIPSPRTPAPAPVDGVRPARHGMPERGAQRTAGTSSGKGARGAPYSVGGSALHAHCDVPWHMHVRFVARGVGSELELQPGTWTVGGAEDDGIRFPGLPPRLLELDLQTGRAWVRCTRPLRVGRAVLEPGVRRWLL